MHILIHFVCGVKINVDWVGVWEWTYNGISELPYDEGTMKRVGVHGLIQNTQGLYLVMKRSVLDVDEANTWDLPGGGLEDDEQLEPGFEREVSEEAGMKVFSTKLLFAYTIEDGSLHLIVGAKARSNQVILGPEHNDYKWVTMEEVKTITPVSLHLEATQYLFKKDMVVARYEEYHQISQP